MLLVHDTRQVLYSNEPACRMFRCECLRIAGRNIVDLVATDEFRHLARIHMQILRERGEAPDIEYPFMRCDDSIFWAKAGTKNLDDGTFIMVLTFTFEFEEW